MLSTDDEEEISTEGIPEELPILPLRNMVLFPGVVMPITVGRDKSINLVKDANKKDKTIGVIAQKDQEDEDPGVDQLNEIGTVARIIKQLRMPDGSTTIIIQGRKRFRLKKMVQTEPYFKAVVKAFNDTKPKKDELNTIRSNLST